MSVQLEFLRSIPYFPELSLTELDSIKKLIFERAAKKDEIIQLEGEPAEALYFVGSGVVKVSKTSIEGKEQIISIIRPGESFNDVPTFDNGLSPTSAQAMGQVTLYGIRKSDLWVILKEQPKLALSVIKVLAERLRQLMSLVEDLSFRHVIGRVARVLLENAGEGTRLTQQEMAAMAGTAREVVSRSLKALEEEGMIRVDHHRIVITDKEGLKQKMGASSAE